LEGDSDRLKSQKSPGISARMRADEVIITRLDRLGSQGMPFAIFDDFQGWGNAAGSDEPFDLTTASGRMIVDS